MTTPLWHSDAVSGNLLSILIHNANNGDLERIAEVKRLHGGSDGRHSVRCQFFKNDFFFWSSDPRNICCAVPASGGTIASAPNPLGTSLPPLARVRCRELIGFTPKS